jgi:hypothetical protein
MVPANGDDAMFNFEWPPWDPMPTHVNYTKCNIWAETCSEDAEMHKYCLDGCQYWRGPTSLGEQGFICELGVDVSPHNFYWGMVNYFNNSFQLPSASGKNATCILNVSGQNMRDADQLHVVPFNRRCGEVSGEQAFWNLRARPILGQGTEKWREFEFGEARSSGVYQVCYCGGFEYCNRDEDFMKWVGTLAIAGKVKRIKPDSTELIGQIQAEIFITDLNAPIVRVFFESSGSRRPCTSITFPTPGQEGAYVKCWLMVPAPFQAYENVTVEAANGLHAISYHVFNRFKQGDFLSISDPGGSTIGGDNISIVTTDLNAKIERITVGGKECLYLKVSKLFPHSRASCIVPPHDVIGPVHVIVYAPNTNTAIGINAYEFFKPADILSVEPNAGGVSGDTQVVITTTDMGDIINYVAFGGVEASLGPGPTRNFVIAFSPYSAIRGYVDIDVGSPNGNSARQVSAFQYMVQCKDPGPPANGYRNGYTFTEGAKLTYACEYGYILKGASEATCEYERDASGNIMVHGGKFEPPRPVCQVISCPDPGIPKFGSRIPANATGGKFTFKMVATFFCPSGYTLFGPKEIFCQGNGLFSGSAPTCESQYGVMTLVRFRIIFMDKYEQKAAFDAADIFPRDGKLYYHEFLVQSKTLGVDSVDAQSLFKQIQWKPGSLDADSLFLLHSHYLVLDPVVNMTQYRILMHSIWNTPLQMFSNADQNVNGKIDRQEFEGQASGMVELVKSNAGEIWKSVATRGQTEIHKNHYLLLTGQTDIALFRTLLQSRFAYVTDTWNASNPNGDNKVTHAEFAAWVLKDYGFDHLIADLLWKVIDNNKKGYVVYVRYVALGFGQVQEISLIGLRGFLQSLYPTRAEVVASLDTDGNKAVLADEFVKAIRQLGLTETNAKSLLEQLCPIPIQNEGLLIDRQLDAVSYDVGLASMRVLIRSEHKDSVALVALADSNGDGQISTAEWISLTSEMSITQTNALRIFDKLNPSKREAIPAAALRLFQGHIAFCDYRELLSAEYGDLYTALKAADLNKDLRVVFSEIM